MKWKKIVQRFIASLGCIRQLRKTNWNFQIFTHTKTFFLKIFISKPTLRKFIQMKFRGKIHFSHLLKALFFWQRESSSDLYNHLQWAFTVDKLSRNYVKLFYLTCWLHSRNSFSCAKRPFGDFSDRMQTWSNCQ